MSKSFQIILIFVGMALAHPHVFIDANVSMVFDETGFAGVRNKWVFDLIYSQAMIAAGDLNKNGTFEKEELPLYQEQVVDAAKEFSRFNYVGDGTRFYSPGDIRDLKVSVSKEGRLVVEFVNMFHIPAVPNDYVMLVIAITDPTNYIMITTDMEQCEIEAPDSMDVEYFVDGLGDLTQFKNFSHIIQGIYVRYQKAP